MATLVVFKFPTAEGAQTMLSTLASLQKQQLIQIEDGAILTWPAGAKKPKTKQLSDMTGAGALGGAFWGMLFGLLFFIPFLGLAIGAAMGALMGHFAHFGFDLVHNVSLEPITPSASACSPRRLTIRMNMLITNTHAGKTRINQDVKSLLTSSSNATA